MGTLIKPKGTNVVINNTADTNSTLQKHKTKSFAEGGAKFIDDAVLHTYNFYAIQALENCEVDIGNCVFLDSFTDFNADFDIPTGTIIYISGSAIQFKTGTKAIIYQRSLADPND